MAYAKCVTVGGPATSFISTRLSPCLRRKRCCASYAFNVSESKEAMLDFLGVDTSASIRSLEWRGVYTSHFLYFGEDLRIKVIFLDLR